WIVRSMLSPLNLPELGTSHVLLANEPSAAMFRSQDSVRPSLVQFVVNLVPLMVMGVKRVVLPAGVHCTDWAFHFPSNADLAGAGAGLASGHAAVVTANTKQAIRTERANFIFSPLGRRRFSPSYQPSVTRPIKACRHISAARIWCELTSLWSVGGGSYAWRTLETAFHPPA